jgi:nicotinamidase-related amidase
MTTLGRTGSALVVIDVQVGVVSEAYERDVIVARIQKLVERSREAGVPVVWVQHSDEGLVKNSPEWEIVPELVPAEGEARVYKNYRNSFEATDLETVLAGLNAGHVYICGAESNNCVRFTTHGALERGYDVTFISDAHTTTGFEWNGMVVDAARVIDEQNTNFWGMELPGRSVRAVPSAEVKF